MVRAVDSRAWHNFTHLALADEPAGYGYPETCAFVDEDTSDIDEIVLRNLRDGVPTVVVTDELELLIVPTRHPATLVDAFDRLIGRVRADLYTRRAAVPLLTSARPERIRVRGRAGVQACITGRRDHLAHA